MSLFTTIPAGVSGMLDDDAAARAILWLPAIGLLLGGIGACVVLAAGSLNATGPGRLLGAALAVAATAVLTGGLHLDGLADTADGLGSRRPAADALEIMRRSDIGPMGVGALVLGLLIQVTAVAAISRLSLAVAALVLAEVTGRVSVVVATSSPAARPGGFGALVAGRTSAAERALTVGTLGCAVAAAGLTAGGPALAAHLARQAQAWQDAGRPGVADLRLTVWPAGSAKPDTAGMMEILRPHVNIAAGWTGG